MAKQRQIRMEQRSPLAAMQRLETLPDEELEQETKFKSAALAILGARAAERYDAAAARDYFRRAIAAARPQERMQLRRMADAPRAAAERRASCAAATRSRARTPRACAPGSRSASGSSCGSASMWPPATTS